MSSRLSDQPGGFGQGPEEKEGRAGTRAGLVVVNFTLLAESSRRVGTAWPDGRCKDRGLDCKRGVKNLRRAPAEWENFPAGTSLGINSPQAADGSSRQADFVVEFVNQQA